MRSIALAAGVIGAVVWFNQSGDLLRPFLRATPIAGLPYGVSAAVTLIDLAVMAAVILLLAPKGGRDLLKLSGLKAPLGGPALMGILLFAPATVAAIQAGAVLGDATAADIAWKGLLGPITEEVGFRGLAIGALMTLCGWRFLPAALIPAALFGAAHLWQGDTPADSAGVFAITGLGGLLFGWLFVRWGFNLWPAIALHVGLNTLFLVFELGENAIGGWLLNALRLGVVAGAIALTLWARPLLEAPFSGRRSPAR